MICSLRYTKVQRIANGIYTHYMGNGYPISHRKQYSKQFLVVSTITPGQSISHLALSPYLNFLHGFCEWLVRMYCVPPTEIDSIRAVRRSLLGSVFSANGRSCCASQSLCPTERGREREREIESQQKTHINVYNMRMRKQIESREMVMCAVATLHFALNCVYMCRTYLFSSSSSSYRRCPRSSLSSSSILFTDFQLMPVTFLPFFAYYVPFSFLSHFI